MATRRCVMAAYKTWNLAGAASLALLVLTAALGAQPPGYYPGAGGLPPCPAPMADPNQLTPANATYAEHSFASTYDPSVDIVQVPFTPSFVAVDFLCLKAVFGHGDSAYVQTGGSQPGVHDFDQRNFDFTPRISARFMPFREFGISGSWFRLESYEQLINFANADPTITFTSLQSPFVSSTLSTTAVPTNLQFRSAFDFQTADLKVDRAWDLGDVMGVIGLGAQYISFSHTYGMTADRTGTTNSVAYDRSEERRVGKE